MKLGRAIVSACLGFVFTNPVLSQEITDTISNMLDAHPEMMIDFTGKSREYCVNTWKVGGNQMTHYATDPSKSQEDVIDFIRLDRADESDVKGMDVEVLPKMPSELGAMEPNQWYYLPAHAYDPHHRTSFPFAMLVRAKNIAD